MDRLITLPQREGGTSAGHAETAVGVPAERRGTDQRAGQKVSLLVGARGALALLFGAVAALWSDVTARGLAAIFGAYVLIDGAMRIRTILARELDHEPPRWGYLLSGCAGLLIGLMTWLTPHITGLALVMLAGAWAIATGVVEVTAAVAGLLETPAVTRQQRAHAGDWLLAASGVTSVVAGIVVLLRPDAQAAAVASVLGSYALIAALVLLAGAWRLRGARASR
jgi:uncharacterized membrane protein HdeD (DUF308 family)